MNSLPHKNTTRLPLRLTLLSAALLAAASSAFAQDEPEAAANPHTITVKDFLGRDRIINDFDGDGWDDLWCAIYRELEHRNRNTDTDGDGLTDYEEMVMWRDPFVEGPLPRDPTPEELEEGRRAREAALAAAKERWEQTKAAAAPRLRPLIPPGARNHAAAHQRVADRQEALRQEAAGLRLLQPAKDRELDAIAASLGVRREIVKPDGSKAILTAEVAGQPVYVSGSNIVGAAGISADELWPSTSPPFSENSTGLDLTGLGETVSLWEPDGGVRASHDEFGTRVDQRDSAPLDTRGHATWVAGTLAADGSATLLGLAGAGRGVAFESDVFAYDLSDFAAERTEAAAGSQVPPLAPAVSLANHSWGTFAGWDFQEQIEVQAQGGGTITVNDAWTYSGSLAPAFLQNLFFGYYTPNAQAGTGCTQVDFFHHTSAPHHLMLYAAGNDRLEGPGAAEQYYVQQGGLWFAADPNTFPRDWEDGDEGGFDSLDAPGTAKNVLTVAACEDVFHIVNGNELVFGFGPGANAVAADFSGAGPTDDGRIKPDLAAVGVQNGALRTFLGQTSGGNPVGLLTPDGSGDDQYIGGWAGTSAATPAVTGGLALLLQRRAQLYPGLTEADALLNSTLKAIAIDTVEDVGAEGPDYRFGHGIFNALSAVRRLEEDEAVGRGALIKEFSLDPTASVSWVVTSDGSVPLTVTAAWSDPPGPAVAEPAGPDPDNPMLVNNIDLAVEQLDTSEPFFPWVLDPDLDNETAAARATAATRGADDRNNVERVTIADPTAGRYRITITHSGGLDEPEHPAPSSQTVSVVAGGTTPELPKITLIEAAPTADEYLLTFTADPGAFFTLETSTDLETWTDSGSVLAESDENTLLVTTQTTDAKRFWRLRRGQ